jgi:hypothetical protein
MEGGQKNAPGRVGLGVCRLIAFGNAPAEFAKGVYLLPVLFYPSL